MKRMKTFLIYLLLVVAVVILTDVIINLILGTNYKEITKYEIATVSPKIEITEAKTTKVNGNIKGTITNETEQFMQDVNIKIEFKSELGTSLGTEYIKKGNFQPGQSKDFSLNFRYSNVDNLIIEATNEEEPSRIELDPIIKNAEKIYKISRIVAYAITPAFYFIPLFLFTTK